MEGDRLSVENHSDGTFEGKEETNKNTVLEGDWTSSSITPTREAPPTSILSKQVSEPALRHHREKSVLVVDFEEDATFVEDEGDYDEDEDDDDEIISFSPINAGMDKRRRSDPSALLLEQLQLQHHRDPAVAAIRRTKSFSNSAGETRLRLEPFIPFWTQQLVRNHKCSQKTFGAFVFVDVSSFTDLAVAFSKLMGDAVGGELVSAYLSKYFQNVTAPLVACGGEILKFAGDAVLIVFRCKEKSELPAVVGRATSAARMAVGYEMTVNLKAHSPKQCVEDFDPEIRGNRNVIVLRNHAAISCGELIGAIVGDMNRKEFVVAGKCLGDLGPALEIAEVKSLVCTSSVFEVLNASYTLLFEFERISPKYLKVSSVPLPNCFPMRLHVEKPLELDPNELKPFVPAAVFEYLSSKTLQFFKMAELRTVTVLFLQVGVGCQVPPALMVNWLQQTSSVVLKKLRRSGGELRQIIVDDKGAVVIGVFGLPHMPVDDKNRCRELKAAASISAKLSLLMIPHAIGLATGRAFCGIIEGSGHKEFVVMGRVVILSARLMAKMGKMLAEAEGEFSLNQEEDLLPILCCEETFKAMYRPEDHSLELIPCNQPMKLKGFDNPIQGYRAAKKYHAAKKLPSDENNNNNNNNNNKKDDDDDADVGAAVANGEAEKVHLSVDTTWGSSALSPAKSGGRSSPSSVHVLSGESRERLQFFFRDSAETFETTPGTTLLVYGAPGCGKTALVTEVIWKLRKQSVESAEGVLVCSCCAGHKNVPYWTLKRLVFAAADKVATNDVSDVKKALKSHEALVGQLKILKKMGLLQRYSDVHDNPLDLLLQLLIHYTSKRVELSSGDKNKQFPVQTVLVIEDVQWCDRESLRILPFLACKIPSAFVMCTLRPSNRCPKIRERFERANAKEIVLKKVADRSIIASIASRVLDVAGIDQALQDHIVDMSEMSPTFTVEICQHLMKLGLIVVTKEDNIAHLKKDATVEELTSVPAVIEKSLLVRYSELTASQQNILKLASALGQEFYFSDLLNTDMRIQKKLVDSTSTHHHRFEQQQQQANNNNQHQHQHGGRHGGGGHHSHSNSNTTTPPTTLPSSPSASNRQLQQLQQQQQAALNSPVALKLSSPNNRTTTRIRLEKILDSLCQLMLIIKLDDEKYCFYDKYVRYSTKNMLSSFDRDTFVEVLTELINDNQIKSTQVKVEEI